MSSTELSDEQKAVVHSAESRLTVTASAGAGKTRVLVERYLRHVLEEGIPPERILTITFTRKAAAEMKSRIVAALRAGGKHELAQSAETGPIQTIHSFCERLLRENSLAAGLDPEFEILSDSQAGRLLQECVRGALSSPMEDHPQASALISSLAGKRRFNDARSPYAQLEASIEAVLMELRGTGASYLELADSHASPELLGKLWESTLLAEQEPDIRSAVAFAEGEDLRARLQIAWKQVRNKVPAWLRGRSDKEAESDSLTYACALMQLACEAWMRLDIEMERIQKVDFTALESQAVSLLHRSPLARDRVRAQFEIVMIDEAQDLNPVQYRLLAAIDPKKELMVGDSQQSIYGFRQADMKLFQERTQIDSKRLSKNYRSEPGILNFVDFAFGAFWESAYSPMNEVAKVFDLEKTTEYDFAGTELWEHAARDASVTAGYVAQLLAEGVLAKDIALLTRDGMGAQAMKRALDEASIPNRIAGGSERFYTRMEVRDLANTLAALADPYDDFALLACLRSPMVGLSLDAVVLLGMNKPVIEALAEFSSPVVEDGPKLRRFHNWFTPLSQFADRLSAWEVLTQVFAQSGYLEALARRRSALQMLANVRKLLVLASEEPELGPREYAERIRSIQELRHKEGDAPTEADDAALVTIMTIHKAKGLEFPVVVVPQTYRPLTQKPKEIVVDAKLKLLATKFGRGESLFYKFLTEREKERAHAEELRVLYVALTRAQKRLCIALYPNSSNDTISKKIRGLFGDRPHPTIRLRQPTQPS